MDTEYKAKWVAALRSGSYKQTQRRLIRIIDDEPHFCCLGVLCEIHPRAVKTEISTGHYLYVDSGTGENNRGSISAALREELDIPCEETSRLITMNDSEGATFTEIADYIEENL